MDRQDQIVVNYLIQQYVTNNSIGVLVGDVTGSPNVVGAIDGAIGVAVSHSVNNPCTAVAGKLIYNVDCSGGDVALVVPAATNNQIIFVNRTDLTGTATALHLFAPGGTSLIGGAYIPAGYWAILIPDGISTCTVFMGFNGASMQTTVQGSVSGTIVWTAPELSTNSKRVLMQFNAMNDAGGDITFPVAFGSAPAIVYNDTGLVITVTTTAATIPVSAGVSGWCILQGF